MSNKPIFVATHPRACSTAFERVFMTRHDSIHTVHEPFGDAYYFGPERMGVRFEDNKSAREDSGFGDSTFKTIMDQIQSEAAEGKRIIIKDMAHYLLPPSKQEACIAPSLKTIKRGVGTGGLPVLTDGENPSDTSSDVDSGVILADDASGASRKSAPFPYENSKAEANNPTVMPREMLEKFHFTFLIRHPKCSIPSYFRCTIPPLVDRTGFPNFMPEEAGYDELRRFFDYCKDTRLVGPHVCGQASQEMVESAPGAVEICVIDADDMLDDPEGILRKYCASVGIEFRPDMLTWDSEEDHEFARKQFAKWDGFHDDAIKSSDLKPRQHKKAPKSDEQLYQEWTEKFGKEGADLIRQTVKDNVADYEYLKQFAIKA